MSTKNVLIEVSFAITIQTRCFPNVDYNPFKIDTTRKEVLAKVGCPSECMVSCIDRKYQLEVSTGNLPGVKAFCGDIPDFHEHVACLFAMLYQKIEKHVCRTLAMYQNDTLALAKRSQMCTPLFQVSLSFS